MDEATFVAAVETAFGENLEDFYFSKIAGVTHPNADGSDRARLLADCRQFEVLALIPQPDNPVDPKAIAVYRHPSGEQLGYLPERTAHDLLGRLDDPNRVWAAVLGEIYRAPDRRIIGSTILVVCLKAERG